MSANTAPVPCPQCGRETKTLLNIDNNLRQRLTQAGIAELPQKVCAACYTKLAGNISSGARAKAEDVAKEQNRITLWKGRLDLVRQGREAFDRQIFSDAVINYEKYIRVLEIVHDLEVGQLDAELLLKNRARQKEIPIVISVLWGLVQIYDSSAKFGDRLRKTTSLMGDFCKGWPGGQSALGQVDRFIDQAKNPELLREMLARAGYKSSRCFIATAAFENPQAPTVLILRNFRDEILVNSSLGRRFINFYYSRSPAICRKIDHSPTSKLVLRLLLSRLASLLQKTFNLPS